MHSQDRYWNEIWAFLIALSIITPIAAVTWLLVPPTSVPFATLTHQLLIADKSVIAPEANEQAAFVVSLLSVPLVLWFAATAAKRLPSGTMLPAFAWTAIAALAAALSIPHDPFRPNVIAPILRLPGTLLGGLVLITVITACTSRVWRYMDNRNVNRSIVFAGILALAVLGYATRLATQYDIPSGEVHFNAFYYSITQAYHGATCFADLTPQYGCYGEFFSIILWPFGVSPLSVTLASTTLTIISTAAMMVFSAALIRSSVGLLTCTIWLVIMTNGVLWEASNPDPYFQYWPLRTLFPSLCLLAAVWWTRSETPSRAAALGLLSGLAIWWNPDTGIVVVIALAGLIAMSGITTPEASFNSVPRKLGMLATYLAAIILSSAAFLAWLSLKSGSLIFPADYLQYQRTFALMGFNMLPVPPLPDSWAVSVALAIAVLVTFAIAIQSKRHSPNLELAAFCAILGLGLFSYFMGRSHPIVFMLVTWPFLILFFYLLDRWQARIQNSLWLATVPRVAMLIAFTAGVATIANATPSVIAKAMNFWERDTSTLPPPGFQLDANYIGSIATADRTLGILSTNQGFIASAINRRSDIPGPGIYEIIRRDDADKVVRSIVDAGPDDLFIERRLLSGELQTWGSLPWIADALPQIMQAYDRVAESPEQTMIYFRRK